MSDAPATNVLGPLAENLLRFLGSLGQRSEAEMYLRAFRQWPGGRFAVLLASRGVLEEHCGSLAEQLKFLTQLGLYPVLVAGALDEVDEELIQDLCAALGELEVAVRVVEDGGAIGRTDEIFIVRARTGNLQQLQRTVGHVVPRKIVVLRRSGGLGVGLSSRVELAPGHFLSTNESGILTVSLRNDLSPLLGAPWLSEDDQRCLIQCRALLEAPGCDPRATVSVASPLSILRELFTVRGAGTLVKLGSPIVRHDGFSGVDVERLRALIDHAFGRASNDRVFERTPLRLYLEAEYRGVALLEPGRGAAFLSKFAVTPMARGEGLGQDLWWALCRETPSFYLRARPKNPINSWYASVCDGLYRTERWTVYFKGIAPPRLPEIIEDAVSRPIDFAEGSS